MVTMQQLDGYLGKHIRDICNNGYVNDRDNHCAHFVSHVLEMQFGVTCTQMGSGKGDAANVRVQEVFARCPRVGTWASHADTLTTCLAFVTNAGNVDLTKKVMSNVPRKHIGIYLGGLVWHYSNAQRKVVKQSPAQFAEHYAAPDNAMFFGTFP